MTVVFDIVIKKIEDWDRLFGDVHRRLCSPMGDSVSYRAAWSNIVFVLPTQRSLGIARKAFVNHQLNSRKNDCSRAFLMPHFVSYKGLNSFIYEKSCGDVPGQSSSTITADHLACILWPIIQRYRQNQVPEGKETEQSQGLPFDQQGFDFAKKLSSIYLSLLDQGADINQVTNYKSLVSPQEEVILSLLSICHDYLKTIEQQGDITGLYQGDSIKNLFQEEGFKDKVPYHFIGIGLGWAQDSVQAFFQYIAQSTDHILYPVSIDSEKCFNHRIQKDQGFWHNVIKKGHVETNVGLKNISEDRILSHMDLFECDDILTEVRFVLNKIREIKESNPKKTVTIICDDRSIADLLRQEGRLMGITLDDRFGMAWSKTAFGRVVGCFLNILKDPDDASLVCSFLRHLFHSTSARGLSIYIEDQMAEDMTFWQRCLEGHVADLDRFKGASCLIDSVHCFRQNQSGDIAYDRFLKEIECQLLAVIEAFHCEEEAPGASGAKSNIEGLFERANEEIVALEGQYQHTVFWLHYLGQWLKSHRLLTPEINGAIPILRMMESRLVSADMSIVVGSNKGQWLMNNPLDSLNKGWIEDHNLLSDSMIYALCYSDVMMLIDSCNDIIFTRSIQEDGEGQPVHPVLEMVPFSIKRHSVKSQDVMQVVEEKHGFPVDKKEPNPELYLRPKRISVTQLEKLQYNPYEYFVEHVLRLRSKKKYRMLDFPYDVYGIAVHFVIEELSKYIFHHQGKDPFSVKENIIQGALSQLTIQDRWQDYIAQKLDVIYDKAVPFIIKDHQKMTSLKDNNRHKVFFEVMGKMRVRPPHNGDNYISDITLTARADRLDILMSGEQHLHARFVDYKTGTPPSKADMMKGRYLQLSLEGMMFEQGAFNRSLSLDGVVSQDQSVFELGLWQFKNIEKELSHISIDDSAVSGVIKSHEVLFGDVLNAYLWHKNPYAYREKTQKNQSTIDLFHNIEAV